MAVTHWYTGRSTETTATVVVRVDSTASVTVAISGQSKNVDCDTSVNDGNAVAEFTGLISGTRYAYTINGTASGFLRTNPASGSTYWIAATSCYSIGKFDSLGYILSSQPVLQTANYTLLNDIYNNLAAYFCLGDRVYMNSTSVINGYSLSLINGGTLANAKNTDIRRNYYRAGHLNTGFGKLIQNVPTYFLKDDHEYDPDNACYSTAWLDLQYGGSHTQQDLDEVWTSAKTAWRDWSQGNPATPISDVDYFKITIGDADFYCTDLIQNRNYHGDADSSTKYMMSAEQEERMLSDMGSSSSPYKVWLSTKMFISALGRNSDGWCNLPGATSEGYETQLGRILSDSRFPSKGALSITGDEHAKSELFAAEGHFGGTSKAISQMAAGPATIDVINDPDDGSSYRTGIRTKERVFSVNASEPAGLGEFNYVLLRVSPSKIDRYILGSRYGLRHRGYIDRNSNNVNA